MAGERQYTFTLRTGEDGSQTLLLRDARPARRSARRWASILAENLNGLKLGLQKAFRLVSRRA